MQNIKLRKVEAEEVIALQKIAKQTFSETFSEINSEENMIKYEQESLSSEKLSSELANPDSQFYFASDSDQVIGYLKVNFGEAQSELQDPNAMEIERIYVLKDYHGQKIGQLLYDQAIAIARESKSQYVWLGVWEENHKALKFYEKNGFVAFDKHIFSLGNDEQTDILMKKILRV
jgi:ribosomal protein S18 acetylase RimI-like enzyme